MRGRSIQPHPIGPQTIRFLIGLCCLFSVASFMTNINIMVHASTSCNITLPSNATWNTCSPVVNSSTSCTFGCATGYELNGTATICNSTGGVLTSTQTCVLNTTQTQTQNQTTVVPANCIVPTLSGAASLGNCSSTLAPGSSCTQTCATHYLSSSYYTCGVNGTNFTSVQTCATPCSIQLPSGGVSFGSCVNATLMAGQTCTTSCNTTGGYTSVGTFQCSSIGSSLISSQVCQSPCSISLPVGGASFANNCSNGLLAANSSCTIDCSTDWTPIGNFQCDHTSSLTSTETCIQPCSFNQISGASGWGTCHSTGTLAAGQSCNMTCANGFISSGMMSCNANGTALTSTQTCSSTCNVTLPQFGESLGTCGSGELLANQNCTATCLPNYTSYGVFACDRTGSSMLSSQTCLAPCQLPALPAGATDYGTCGNNGILLAGQSCSINCNGTSSSQYTCDSAGSGALTSSQVCHLPCTFSLPAGATGAGNCPTNGTLTPGASCTATCGSFFVSSGSFSCSLGNVSTLASVQTCTQPCNLTLPNGVTSWQSQCNNGILSAGQTCTVPCANNYLQSGTFTCSSQAQLTSSQSCVAPCPIVLPLGGNLGNCTSPLKPGTTCSLGCVAGYAVDRPLTACSTTGQLNLQNCSMLPNDGIVYTDKPCDNPLIPNAVWGDCAGQNPLPLNGACSFYCNSGYTSDITSTQCNNGRLSAQTCSPTGATSCANPLPAHASWNNCPTTGILLNNYACQFTCAAGFTSDNILTACVNGILSGQQCIANAPCPYSLPEHTTGGCPTTGSLAVGTSCSVNCTSGYVLQGDSVVSCSYNSVLSGSQRCVLPSYHNCTFNSSALPIGTTSGSCPNGDLKHLQTCQTSCAAGYIPATPLVPATQCVNGVLTSQTCVVAPHVYDTVGIFVQLPGTGAPVVGVSWSLNTPSYTLTVPYSQTSLQVDAIFATPGAVMVLIDNGNTGLPACAPSGRRLLELRSGRRLLSSTATCLTPITAISSSPVLVGLGVGPNVVTVFNHVDNLNWTISISRTAPTDGQIISTGNGGVFDTSSVNIISDVGTSSLFQWAPAITTYQTNVPNSVQYVTLTAVSSAANSLTWWSGSFYSPQPFTGTARVYLSVGDNIIHVVNSVDLLQWDFTITRATSPPVFPGSFTTIFDVTAASTCATQLPLVQAACSISLPPASPNYPTACPGTPCAKLLVPFVPQCYPHMYFIVKPANTNETSAPMDQAQLLATACLPFQPLQAYYPTTTSAAYDACSELEATVASECGLSFPISTFPINRICPATCSLNFQTFNKQCLSSMTSTSNLYTNAQSLLASCILNTPSAPAVPATISLTPLSGGTTIGVTWLVDEPKTTSTGAPAPDSLLPLVFLLEVTSDSTGASGWSTIYTGNQYSATARNLSPSTNYYFRISVSNDVGTGPTSALTSATTRPLPPNPVTGLTITATTATSFSVAWTAPAVDSTRAVAATFQPAILINGVVAPSTVGSVSASTTSYTFEALVPFTTYSVVVRAISSTGDISASSNIATTTTLVATPPAPIKASVWTTDDHSVTATIYPLNMARYYSVTSYNLYLTQIYDDSTSSVPIMINVAVDVDQGEFNYKFSGLFRASNYSITYSAVGQLTGPLSDPCFLQTAPSPPTPVQQLGLNSNVTTTGFSISWGPPADFGGTQPFTWTQIISGVLTSFYNSDITYQVTGTAVDPAGRVHPISTSSRYLTWSPSCPLAPGSLVTLSVVCCNRVGCSAGVSFQQLLLMTPPNLVGLVASFPDNKLDLAFNTGVMVTLQFDASITVGNANAFTDGSITWSPAMTCQIASQTISNGTGLLLTFNNLPSGCVPPVIGQTTVSLSSTALVSGSNVEYTYVGSSSSSTSALLSGSFGTVPILAIANKPQVSIAEGSSVGVATLFTLTSRLRAVTNQVTAVFKSDIGSFNVNNITATGTQMSWSNVIYTAQDFSARSSPYNLFVQFLDNNGNLVETVYVALIYTLVNHPISLTNVASSIVVGAGVPHVLPAFTIVDPDTRVFPFARAKLTISTFPGFVSPGATTAYPSISIIGHTETYLLLTGTIVELNAYLAAGSVTINFDSSDETGWTTENRVYINVDDLDNGQAPSCACANYWQSVTVAGATIPVTINCALNGRPVLVSAQIDDWINSVILTFDMPLTLPSSNPTPPSYADQVRNPWSYQQAAGYFNCLNLLDDASQQLFGTWSNCFLSSPELHQYSIYLGQNNTISVGATLTLRSNTVARCPVVNATQTLFGFGSVQILAPANPYPPQLSLWSANRATTGMHVISSCDTMQVTSWATSSGNQPFKYYWSISGNNIALDLSNQGQVLTIANDLTLPGDTYSVSLTVVDFLGFQSSLQSMTISVRTMPTPTVIILAALFTTVIRGGVSNFLLFDVEASLPPCLPSAYRQLTYVWTSPQLVFQPISQSIPWLSLDLTQLALVENVIYTFDLQAVSVTEPSVFTNARIYFEILPAILSVSVDQADIREVSLSQSLYTSITVFDASYTSASVNYAWSCMAVPSTQVCPTLPFTNSNSFQLPAGVLSPGLYVFTVAVSKEPTRPTVSVSYNVTVMSADQPQVHLTCPPNFINTDSSISIGINVQPLSSFSLLSYTYNMAPAGALVATATASGSFTPASLTSFVYNQGGVSNTWLASTVYYFSLSVTEQSTTSAGVVSTATTNSQCMWTVRGTPYGGSFNVFPRTGVAANDKFHFTATNWQASPVADTLAYVFYYRDELNQIVPLTSSTTLQNPSGAHLLPFTGLPTDATTTTVTVGVQVTDTTTLATSYAEQTVTLSAAKSTKASAYHRGEQVMGTGGHHERTFSATTGVNASMNVAAASAAFNQILSDAQFTGDANSVINGVLLYGVTPLSGTAADIITFRSTLWNAVITYSNGLPPARLIAAAAAVAKDPKTLDSATCTSIVNQLSAAFTGVILQVGAGTRAPGDHTGALVALPQSTLQSASLALSLILDAVSNFDAPTGRSLVELTYKAIKVLLSLTSQSQLNQPGSSYSSALTVDTVQSVRRFLDSSSSASWSVANGVSIQFQSTLSDANVVDVVVVQATMDPFFWVTEFDATTTMFVDTTPVVTVDVTSNLGVSLVDTSLQLKSLSSYQYTLSMPLSLTACPTATCQPICQLYDPSTSAWTPVGIITSVDSAHPNIVQCRSSIPGHISLSSVTTPIKSPLNGSTGSDGAALGDTSSSGLSPATQGLIAGVVVGVVVLFLLAFVPWYIIRRRRIQLAEQKGGINKVIVSDADVTKPAAVPASATHEVWVASPSDDVTGIEMATGRRVSAANTAEDTFHPIVQQTTSIQIVDQPSLPGSVN